MRIYNEAFALINADKSKQFVYTIEINFSNQVTDRIYITSHPEASAPDGETIYSDVISSHPSGSSQKLQENKFLTTIGSQTFSFIDKDFQLSKKIRDKFNSGLSLSGQIVKIYMGFPELGFEQYELIPNGVQIIEEVTRMDNEYSITCSDTNRLARRSIFTQRKTRLITGYNPGDTSLDVATTTNFEMVAHTSFWNKDPNVTIGYVKIKDTIFSYTSKTATTFDGIQAGRFGTDDEPIEVLGASNDDIVEVTEFIYIDMPVVKLIYALYTGALLNQGVFIPPAWSAGVDPIHVDLPSFTGIDDDLWAQSNDKGIRAEFIGLAETDAKAFIERELLPLIGCYILITANGSLSIRRSVSPLSSSAALVEIQDPDIIDYSDLTHATSTIVNVFNVQWDHSGIDGKFARQTDYIDSDSIGKYQRKPAELYQFKGLSGNNASSANVRQIIDYLRDVYSAEHQLLNLTLSNSNSAIEVGDNIRVKSKLIFDDKSEQAGINRTFRTIGVDHDFETGGISLQLIGSTRKTLSSTDLVSDDTIPSIAIPNFLAYLTSQRSGYTLINTLAGYSLIGPVGHLTADVVITNAQKNIDRNVWYHDGDLVIDAGVTLDLQAMNTLLVVDGLLTLDGDIRSIGGTQYDLSGGLDKGYGSTEGQGGVIIRETFTDSLVFNMSFLSTSGEVTQDFSMADVRTLPSGLSLSIEDDPAATELGKLGGLPIHINGIPGGSGGRIELIQTPSVEPGLAVPINGYSGGAGGGGLAIFCKGLFMGSGKINLSGASGSRKAAPELNNKLAAGSGSGGYPGSLIVLLADRNSIVPILTEANFIASLNGPVPAEGYSPFDREFVVDPVSYPKTQPLDNILKQSYKPGSASRDLFSENHSITYLLNPDSVEPSDDRAQPKDMSNLQAFSGTAQLILSASGKIVTRALLTWDRTLDRYVDRYRIQYKRTIEADSEYVTHTVEPDRNTTRTYIPNLADGVSYDFQIYPINIFNRRSANFLSLTHTVIGKTAAPADPTGLSALGVTGGIDVSWTASVELDHFETIVFRSPVSGGPFTEVGRTTGDTFFNPAPESVLYYYAIQFIDTTGNLSSQVGEVSARALSGFAAIQIPNVTGLHISNLPINTVEYTTPNVSFEWRRVQSPDRPSQELGAEDNGGDTGYVDPTIQGYRVRMYRPGPFIEAFLLREEQVHDERYDYTIDKNKLDNGDPIRSFSVEIRAYDQFNNLSPIPARMSVTNPISAVTEISWSITPGVQQFTVNVTAHPNDLDYLGSEIHVSTTPAFTPTAATRFGLVGSNAQQVIVDSDPSDNPLVNLATYYVKLVPYDQFELDLSNVTNELAVTLTALAVSIEWVDVGDTDGFKPENDATVGADWGTNISDSLGFIPDDNATLGADWGTNISDSLGDIPADNAAINTPLAACKDNFVSLSTAASLVAGSFIHGFSKDASPADIDATIYIKGVAVTLPRGNDFGSLGEEASIYHAGETDDGYVIYNASISPALNFTTLGATLRRTYAFARYNSGTWEYNDGNTWLPVVFSPGIDDYFVIGRGSTGNAAFGNSNGISLFQHGVTLNVFPFKSDFISLYNGPPLNNYLGVAAPVASNDSTEGYSIGSEWTFGQAHYKASSVAVGAAVWDQLNSTGLLDNLAAVAVPNISNDSTEGYSIGSRWIFGSIAYVATSVAISAAVWAVVSNPKDEIGAAVPPSVIRDSTLGYSIGSRWFFDGSVYMATDVTANNAVWVFIYNDSPDFDGYFAQEAYDNWKNDTSVIETVSINTAGSIALANGRTRFNCGGNASDGFEARRMLKSGVVPLVWTKRRRFITAVQPLQLPTGIASWSMHITTGDRLSQSATVTQWIGFRIENTASGHTIFAAYADGTTQFSTSIVTGAGVFQLSVDTILEAVVNADGSIGYSVNNGANTFLYSPPVIPVNTWTQSPDVVFEVSMDQFIVNEPFSVQLSQVKFLQYK